MVDILDLSTFKSEFSFRHKLLRTAWALCWLLLFRPTPRNFYSWRAGLLKLFGTRVGRGVRISNSVRVYYPPNLFLGDYVVVGADVDLYCVAPITLKDNSMVSQYSYLCTASHDYTKSNLPLIAFPITIGSGSWICSRAFIGPGISVGTNSLVAACAVVVKDVTDNQIVGGNPAKFIKTRPPTGDGQ